MAELVTFSDQEIEVITTTFKEFSANGKYNMTQYFHRLCKYYPGYQFLFSRLANIPLSEVATSNYVRHVQGPRTLSLMADFVERLNSKSVASMRHLVRRMVLSPSHARVNLKAIDFKNSFDIFVRSMEKTLGHGFVETGKPQWVKFINYLTLLIEEVEATKGTVS